MSSPANAGDPVFQRHAIEPKLRGVLDPPLSRRMTVVGWGFRSKVICPTGCLATWLSSPIFKNISVFAVPKSPLYPPPSRPTEGRWPSSLTRDGMRWTRQRRARKWNCRAGFGLSQTRERSNGALTNDAEADGKAVWSWHPLLMPSWRRHVGPTGRGYAVNSPTTVTRRIRRRGERGGNR